MTQIEIAKNIADIHNMLASITSSGGIQLLNADSVIMMGEVFKALRSLAQQIAQDYDAEQSRKEEKA